MLFSWLPQRPPRSSRAPKRHRQARFGRIVSFPPRLERLEDRLMPNAVNWIGGSGDWDTAGNWLDATTHTNHLPTASDDAVINVAGITVTHNAGNSDAVNTLTSP